MANITVVFLLLVLFQQPSSGQCLNYIHPVASAHTSVLEEFSEAGAEAQKSQRLPTLFPATSMESQTSR